jgi:hypothetical protein
LPLSELGDFASEPWIADISSEAQQASVVLKRKGGVWVGGKHQPVVICKTITLAAGEEEARIEYSITNCSNEVLPLWWASEWNVALSGTDTPVRHYHCDYYHQGHKEQLGLDEIREFAAVSNLVAGDSWLRLQVQWELPQRVQLWHVPIWSISQKEGGFIERTHQSSAFVFQQHLKLKPNEEWTFAFSAKLVSKRPLA